MCRIRSLKIITWIMGLALLTSGPILASDDKEPIFLKIHPNSGPLKLPDGSKVTRDGFKVWVQELGQTCYATSWQDYAHKKGLNIATIIDSGSGIQNPELRIIRGCSPFKLPDGSEVSHNGNDEIWVKTLGQTYYATPWAAYATQTGISIQPVLVSRSKPLVELKITCSSPLFAFKLPDSSEVHVNSSNKVWVKTPQQSYPGTRWEDYIYSRKLSIWPKVVAGSADKVELSIMRGGAPFWLPGGYKVATNSADEVWVQKPGVGYYATSWAVFAQEVGLIAQPVLTDEKYPTPIAFYEPQNGMVQEGYKGVFKVVQQASEFGYETFSGKIFTPEFLGTEAFKRTSKKYKHSDLAVVPPRNHQTALKIIDQDSFVAAQEMIALGLNPCVSNAANAIIPGGGAKDGAQAQEEELCKRSNLYKALLPELYPMQESAQDGELIYTPDVVVFLNQKTYTFMDTPFKVAVISQAYIALYERFTDLLEPENSPEYQRITKGKISAFLKLAALKGHDSLVLAASGCGAFSRGRPGPVSKVVAQLFHQVILNEFQGIFKEIRFAILSTGPNPIIAEFRKEFVL